MTAAPVAGTTAGLTTWDIDPAHSHVEFAVRHMMIATVKGRFGDVQGTVRTRGSDFTTAEVNVTINVASVDTRQEQRDAHLRSPDFFDAEQFPTMTFRSTRVTKDGDDYRVTGDLTIRGNTREVTLTVTSEGQVRDPWGKDRAGFSATTKLSRKEFGLSWNAALETGGFVVDDTIKVTVDAELVRQEA